MKKRVLLAVSVVLSMVSAADAGLGVWTGGGPEGGSIDSVVAIPGTPVTLLAGGISGGLSTSTDGAATWANSPAPSGAGVRDLAVAADGALFLIVCCDSDVYRSTDSGLTWTSAATGTTSLATIAPDPVTAGTVYVGGSGGVYKSIDSGATWSSSNTGIDTQRVEAIAIDPTTPATIYAGTSNAGVFRSTDSGANWSAWGTGLTTDQIRVLAVDPANPSNLMAGTADQGIFTSLDGGATWGSANTGLPADIGVSAIAVNPTSSSSVLVGISPKNDYTEGRLFSSADFGATWSELITGVTGHYVNDLIYEPGSTTIAYAATSGGILKTTDGGTNWSEQNSGLQAFSAGEVRVQVNNSNVLYTTNGALGVYKSIDGGATWAAANTGLPKTTVSGQGHGLAISQLYPEDLYVTLSDAVYKTTNGATTWTDATGDPSVYGAVGPYVLPLAVSPTGLPSPVFAGNLAFFISSGNPQPLVLETVDGGASWSPVLEAEYPLRKAQPTEILIDGSGATLFVGALVQVQPDFSRGYRVWRSLSSGNAGTWEEVLSGSGPDFNFPDLARGANGDTFVLIQNPVPTLFRSTDNGTTWSSSTPPGLGTSAYGLEADPVQPGLLYASSGYDLLVSVDHGTSWSTFPRNGIPDGTAPGNVSVTAVAAAPRLFHLATRRGVYSYSSSIADLTVEKTDGLTEILPGSPLTYTIEVANPTGPDDVMGVEVTDTLPAELTCTWSCAASGGGWCTWTPPAGDLSDLADLPVGASVTYTASCTLDAGATGTLTNTASAALTTGWTELQSASNTATDSDLVLETGPCGEYNDRHLSNQVIDTNVTFTACQTITAGQGFEVVTPGVVSFVAGDSIALEDGFAIFPDSIFTATLGLP